MVYAPSGLKIEIEQGALLFLGVHEKDAVEAVDPADHLFKADDGIICVKAVEEEAHPLKMAHLFRAGRCRLHQGGIFHGGKIAGGVGVAVRRWEPVQQQPVI